MSSDGALLEVRDLGKCYKIYKEPHHRLLQTLFRGRRKFYQDFEALRGVSFCLRRGQSIGIIGRNGSGKSTLLKLIAGTLTPTSGQVSLRGSVAALLELGSGFNPEFTGRENVYLNAALLGLSRAQINDRFDAIARFADIGDFLDRPIKTYSSGMKVRLAFAVQIQVEPDLLIVDEALAVGDAAFRAKCMDTMRELLKRGTSLLFVSHSIQAVRSFCDEVIWLDAGRVRMAGATLDVCSSYMEHLFTGQTAQAVEARQAESDPDAPAPEAMMVPVDHFAGPGRLRRWGSGEIRVTDFAFTGPDGRFRAETRVGEACVLRFRAKVLAEAPSDHCALAFSIKDCHGADIIAVSSGDRGQWLKCPAAGDELKIECRFKNVLVPGEYRLVLAVEHFDGPKRNYCDFVENVMLFQVSSDRRHHGVVEPQVEMKVEQTQLCR